jgi:hypothetical protein
MTYDYTSQSDMQALAREVSDIPADKVQLFYAAVLSAGIMRMPWYWRFSVGALRRLKRLTPVAAWFIVLGAIQKQVPTVYQTAIFELCRHIVYGQDTVDQRSAGGLNGPEVNTLLFLMSCVGWQPVQPVAQTAVG